MSWWGGADCVAVPSQPPVSLCNPHTGISLSVSLLTRPGTLSSLFSLSSSPPSLQHWSFSLESPLKRCGVFVQPDKGCHSSPFPLLCGPGLAAPVEVQMLSSRRGYPHGPWRAISLSLSLSLLKAWLITTLLPPSL